MYWCKKCGQINEDAVNVKRTSEYHGEVDTRQYDVREEEVCPYCGGELEAADMCDCGEWKDRYEDYCVCCRNIASVAIQNAIKEIKSWIPEMDYNKAYELLSYEIEEERE